MKIEFIESEEQLELDESEMKPNKSYSGVLNVRSFELDNVLQLKAIKGFQIEKIAPVANDKGYRYNLIFSKDMGVK